MDRTPAPGRAEQIEEMFSRLVDLPEAERGHYLSENCPDQEFRSELEALLEADACPDLMVGPLGDAISKSTGSILPRPVACGRSFPSVGQEISHYRVLAPAGQGGMGVVVRARDQRLQRDVALKLLPASAVPTSDARRRLLREARAAAALDHPNICTVYEVGETDEGELFIAMAYCEGETLAERLQRGPLAPAEALDLVEQLAAALAAAHAAGILHCDVKPSNVMLTATGWVRLVDFGIARLPAEQTGQGRIRGTLAYMAPEQLRGEEIDARVDVWAMGVLLYECLTGTHPFRADTDPVTMYRILNSPAPDLPQALEQKSTLQALLARCLAASPEERFADGAAFHAALRKARAAQPDSGALQQNSHNRRGTPLAPTRLIGRAQELQALGQALRSSPLVTVTGTAGTGKTRLVLEAVRNLAPRFPAGVVYVSLAAVSDSTLVATEIASELDLVDQPTRAAVDLLCEDIGDREMLLVLDNFEQVAAAAPLLSALLARCARLRILVTSRVALRIRGEQEFPLDPLLSPPPEFEGSVDELESYAATALFLERARAVRRDFSLDQDAALAVASICRHLDGLPLAIELAAAQVRLFPPAVLLERLSHRLDALASGARDSPQRHRTMRDAIAWSYRLLGSDERKLFRLAGVFAGGADLEALEQIGAAVLERGGVLPAIHALAAHSLLRPTTGAGGRARLTMLDTVREFALEQLVLEDVESPIRRLHAENYMRLAELGALELSGAEQALWLHRLEQEHDNFRAALNWAEAAGEAELALRIGAALCRFWIMRGHVREGLERLNRLQRMGTEHSLRLRRAALLAGAGALVHETGDFQGAQPLLESALALFREQSDDASIAAVLNTLAWTRAHTGPLHQAEQFGQEALDLCRARGDSRAIAVALHNLAWIEVYRGLPSRAIEFANGAIEIREGLGDRRGAAFTLANRARAERQAGRLDAAHATLAQALAVARELNDQQLLGLIHLVVGQVRLDQGAAVAGAESLRAALDLWQHVRHEFAAGDCLNWLAAAELQAGMPEKAAARLAEATEIWNRIGGPWGRAATLFRRGQLARQAAHPDAVELLEQSLFLRREIGDLLGEAECLEELAACAGTLDSSRQPVELLERAGSLRRSIGAPQLAPEALLLPPMQPRPVD